MPHSGGGGSHSGGHSSHSSHGSGGSSTRVSSKPFAGCYTYAIYDKNGGVRLAYSNSKDYHAEKTKSDTIATVLFSSPFALIGLIEFIVLIWFLAGMFHNGIRKTNYPDSVRDKVYIFDEQNYVDDYEEERLIDALEEFRDKTGIIPAVEFTDDEHWRRNYTDMEAYAYDKYVSRFNDEYHLLVVYSYGYTDYVTGFNEFNWHTMWGDDLGKTAKGSDEEYFGDLLQKEFSRANGANVPEAVCEAFDEFLPRLDYHGFRPDGETLAIMAFLLVHGGVFFIVGVSLGLSAIKDYKKSKNLGEVTYKINDTPKLLNCPYCETSYYYGTIGTCKFCGAPISYDEATI